LRAGSRLDFCHGNSIFFTCLDEQPLTENVATSRNATMRMRHVRIVMIFPRRFRAIGIVLLPVEVWTLRNGKGE
jgi:hypothetical protein